MLNSIIKNFSKDALNYGLGGAFSKILSFLLLPFLTEKISPDEYGIFALLSLLTMALGAISNLGTTNSMSILFFEEENFKKRERLIWTNFLLLLFINLILIYITIITSSEISEFIFGTNKYRDLIFISILGLSLSTLTEPFLNYLRMERKSLNYLSYTIFKSILFVSLTLYIVIFLNEGLKGYIFSITLTNLIFLISILILVGRKLSFRLISAKIPQLIKIGFPSIFGVFAFIFIDYADRTIIEYIIGIKELGIYTVAYSLGMVALLFTDSFSLTWSPFFNSFIKRQKEAQKIFPIVFSFYTSISLIITILFFYLSKPIIYIFTESSYHSGYVVIGFIAFSYLIKGVYLIFLPGIYFNKKLYIQSLIEWFSALVNIFLNFLLIPIFGITGAAIATLLSYVMLSMGAYFFGNRFLPINYDWSKLFINTIIATFSITLIFINDLIYSTNFLKELLINSTILIISVFIIYKINFKTIKIYG